jgi:electron transport complex protein RnfC
VGLDPEELYKTAGISGGSESSGSVLAKQCHSCGCCDLVCPSRLPLSAVIANFARENNLWNAQKTLLQVTESLGKPSGEEL